MHEDNPYRAPESSVAKPIRSTPGNWRISALVLIGLQTLLSIMDAQSTLDRVRHGETSPLALLCHVAASALLVFGGAMLIRKPRVATYLLAASGLFWVIALLQSSWPVAITGIGIAVISALVSLRTTTRPA